MTIRAGTDLVLMGHLLRRAAFGAPASTIERYAEMGYEEAVESLLEVEKFPRLEEDLLERFYIQHADEEATRWTAARWMFRMINSQRPLEEKVALMWHGVFATGYAKVTNNPMMRSHYEMLRDRGLGNFQPLLVALARDPAMIYWLDQQMNHTEAVNENFGRELLELFSMGRGNYTEDDVQACARAFTGWTKSQTIPRYPTGFYHSEFVYRPEDHDDSVKTFLGETGPFNGEDVIAIIVRHPATATFVGTVLHKFFVSDDPDSDAIEQLAQAFVESNHEIRDVLRFLFNADFFKEARFKKVKSPVEVVAGTALLAGRHTDAYEFGLTPMTRKTAIMGQELLNPPTVEGWHTGREWIDSSYLIERVNFAAETLGDTSAPGVIAMIERITTGRHQISPDELLDACLYEMGCIELKETTKRILIENLDASPVLDCASGGDRSAFDEVVAQMLRLIVASREYQMA